MTEAHISARIKVISLYIDDFIKKEEVKGKIFVCNSEEMASSIVNLYENYAETLVRPSINSGIIQNYKIISNTELAVLRIAPLTISDNQIEEKLYNSKLALHIALRILIEWNDLKPNECESLFNSDNEIKSFLEEHLTWLYLLKPAYYYPIFSNSQVWRLFHYLLKERLKNL